MSLCLSVCIFHCFINKDNNLPLGYLGGIVLMVQIHKIVFTLVTFPKGAVLEYFCTFILIVTFLCSSFSREPFNCFTSFFTDVVSITLKVISLKKFFRSIFPSAGSHFEVFRGSFWGMLLYFWRAVLSYLIKLCTVVFCITLTVNGLRKILQYLYLLFCKILSSRSCDN